MFLKRSLYLNQSIKICLIFILLGFLALSFTQRITLVTADLGRHIKSGEVFLEKKWPITTNYYSYTQPEFTTVNHHWLTGVIFYWLQKQFGFDGLSVIYTGLFLLSFVLFFEIARRASTFSHAFFISILVIPLITNRQEIRPEVFSYLFLGAFLFVLYQYQNDQLSRKWLWLIPLLQILWVNLHIFFIMGLCLIAFFYLQALLSKDQAKTKIYLMLAIATLAASFLNPYGWQGVLTPLTIFKEYGYRLIENQSIIFMHKRFPANLIYIHFEVLFGLALFLFAARGCFRRENSLWLWFFIMSLFSVLTWRTNRNIPLFGLFFIPFAAQSIFLLMQHFSLKWKRFLSYGLIIFSCSLLMLPLLKRNIYYSPYQKNRFGWFFLEIDKKNNWLAEVIRHPQYLFGLVPGVNHSAEFFKRFDLKGPIFNNYDIGGYLIYHLFPKERVFVDNRPESYSVSFFKDLYIPMQEREDVWQKADAQYGFNVIYFYRHDMTPWGQAFLVQRIQDSQWVPVFVDHFAIIFLKRNMQNAQLIKQFELPKSMFRIVN